MNTMAARDAHAEAAPARVVPRPSRETDLPFVLNTWSNSWRLSQTAKRLPGTAYREVFDQRVTRGLFERSATSLVVLSLERDPDEIAGWLCYTPDDVPVVHYVFVRRLALSAPHEQLRRAGLMLAMLHLAGVTDAVVYTFRPAERSHPRDNRVLGVEPAIVAALAARGIAAKYRPIEQYLWRTR